MVPLTEYLADGEASTKAVSGNSIASLRRNAATRMTSVSMLKGEKKNAKSRDCRRVSAFPHSAVAEREER